MYSIGRNITQSRQQRLCLCSNGIVRKKNTFIVNEDMSITKTRSSMHITRSGFVVARNLTKTYRIDRTLEYQWKCELATAKKLNSNWSKNKKKKHHWNASNVQMNNFYWNFNKNLYWKTKRKRMQKLENCLSF